MAQSTIHETLQQYATESDLVFCTITGLGVLHHHGFGCQKKIIIDILNVGRYKVYGKTHIIWNTKENEDWQKERELGDMPLVPGDRFIITGHLHNDSLTLTLNEAHIYSIPLGRLQDGIDGVDISQSTLLGINGKVELTYLNLISAC